ALRGLSTRAEYDGAHSTAPPATCAGRGREGAGSSKGQAFAPGRPVSSGPDVPATLTSEGLVVVGASVGVGGTFSAGQGPGAGGTASCSRRALRRISGGRDPLEGSSRGFSSVSALATSSAARPSVRP